MYTGHFLEFAHGGYCHSMALVHRRNGVSACQAAQRLLLEASLATCMGIGDWLGRQLSIFTLGSLWPSIHAMRVKNETVTAMHVKNDPLGEVSLVNLLAPSKVP